MPLLFLLTQNCEKTLAFWNGMWYNSGRQLQKDANTWIKRVDLIQAYRERQIAETAAAEDVFEVHLGVVRLNVISRLQRVPAVNGKRVLALLVKIRVVPRCEVVLCPIGDTGFFCVFFDSDKVFERKETL